MGAHSAIALLALATTGWLCLSSMPAQADANANDFFDCTWTTSMPQDKRLAACDRAIRDSADNRVQQILALAVRGALLSSKASMQAASDRDATLKAALADFDRALALKPDRRSMAGNLYVGKGMVLSNLKDAAGAKAAFDAAFIIDPDNWRAVYVRAGILDADGDKRNAALAYERTGELGTAQKDTSDEIAEAWNAACWIRAAFLVDDMKKARDDCDKAITLQPKGAYYDSRGMVGLREGNFGMALQDYAKAAQLLPDVASPWYGKAIAELRIGQVEQSRADFAQASKLDRKIGDTYEKDYKIRP